VSGQQHAPAALSPGKDLIPILQEAGRAPGLRAENLVTTGIRSRTVQPVVSRYTDRATGPTVMVHSAHKSGVLHDRTLARHIVGKLLRIPARYKVSCNIICLVYFVASFKLSFV